MSLTPALPRFRCKSFESSSERATEGSEDKYFLRVYRKTSRSCEISTNRVFQTQDPKICGFPSFRKIIQLERQSAEFCRTSLEASRASTQCLDGVWWRNDDNSRKLSSSDTTYTVMQRRPVRIAGSCGRMLRYFFSATNSILVISNALFPVPQRSRQLKPRRVKENENIYPNKTCPTSSSCRSCLKN